jgi:K+-transporting ATPase ATPase C chain
MLKELIPALRITLVLALLTGLAFPLLITMLSQVIFPDQANGSLVKVDGKVVGSKLLAQSFESPKYFHPRPSAAGSGYAGEASGGTNLGPTSAKLIDGIADDPATKTDESFLGIKQLAENYRKENGLSAETPVPVDAVTRSASGLDPDISEANALLQADRVAKARQLKLDAVTELIHKYKSNRDLQILGEPRLNVLTINLAMDNIK